MIETLKRGTSEAVDRYGRPSAARRTDSVEQSEEAGRALSIITMLSGVFAMVNSEIASAVEQQSDAAEAITRVVRAGLRDVNEQTRAQTLLSAAPSEGNLPHWQRP